MRPKSVVLAEQLYLGSIVVFAAIGALTWTPTVEAYGAGVAAGLLAFVVGLSLMLLIFTTRRASRVALGGLTLLTLFTAAGVLMQVSSATLAAGPVGVLTVVQLLLVAIPNVLLFLPRSREWFHRAAEARWEQQA